MSSMAAQPSVLVLGAGELGAAVLDALASHSQHGSVTVLLRPSTIASTDTSKRAQLNEFEARGIAILPGDIASATVQELVSLFAPFHTVIGCTGMTYPSGTQLKILRAALAAKVRRYLPWQFGGDYDAIGRGSSQDLFNEQLDVRDLLRQQEETEWVVISTGIFTSFLFWPPFGIVTEDLKTVRALGSWDTKVTVTSPRDIGRVVAEIVWAHPALKGVVYAAGQTLSCGQLADIVEKHCNGVTREAMTLTELKAQLAADPENMIKKYRLVFAEGRGVSWDESITFNHKLGMMMQNVDNYIQENYK